MSVITNHANFAEYVAANYNQYGDRYWTFDYMVSIPKSWSVVADNIEDGHKRLNIVAVSQFRRYVGETNSLVGTEHFRVNYTPSDDAIGTVSEIALNVVEELDECEVTITTEVVARGVTMTLSAKCGTVENARARIFSAIAGVLEMSA